MCAVFVTSLLLQHPSQTSQSACFGSFLTTSGHNLINAAVSVVTATFVKQFVVINLNFSLHFTPQPTLFKGVVTEF